MVMIIKAEKKNETKSNPAFFFRVLHDKILCCLQKRDNGFLLYRRIITINRATGKKISADAFERNRPAT